MKDFIQRNKFYLLIILLVGVLIYGIRIFSSDISIDTEILINTPEQILNMWMSFGRFGLVGIKELFHLVPINITLTNIFTFIFFFLSIIIWMINIEKIQKSKNKYATLIFGLSLMISPIFVEQFGFTLQSLEVSIAFLFVALGIFFQEKYFETNKIIYSLITILLIAGSFMCYQAFIVLYITICVFDYIAKYKDKTDYKLILKYLVIFAIACVLYFGISAVLTNVLNVEKDTYIQDQIKWGEYGIVEGIGRMILLNAVTTSPFLGIQFDLILVCIFTILSYYLLKNIKLKENKLFYLIYIFMFVTPFITGIIKGDVELYRAKFSLAFLIAFALYYLINNVETKKLKLVLNIFVTIFIVSQTITSFSLFFIDNQRYQNDIEIGNQINETIKNLNTDKPVVFVGKKEYTKYFIRGEMLGHSFFEWDAKEEYGINERTIGFLKTIGIEYRSADLEQIQKAREEAKEMPIWPEDNSIVEKEDYIIVNFGVD